MCEGQGGEEEVWNEFSDDPTRCEAVAAAIIASLETSEGGSVQFDPDEEEGVEEALEGRLLTRRHLARERNRKLVASKLKSVLKSQGKLTCEGCGFDFEAVYGSRG